MDEELKKEDITKMTSQDLAAIIVMQRCLGQFKEETELAMLELMKRKVAGDTFDFQSFIEENLKKYQIKIDIPTFQSTKTKISKVIFDTIIDITRKTDNFQNIEKANNIDDDDDEDDDI